MRRLPTHTSLTLLTALVHTASAESWQDCYYGKSSRFNGTVAVTKTGKTCQTWGDPVNPEQPHKHVPTDMNDYDKKPHNYCRNPEGDLSGTWCYTTDPNTRWEYCSVKKCESDTDEAFVYWTMVDGIMGVTRIVTIPADPEKVKQAIQSSSDW